MIKDYQTKDIKKTKTKKPDFKDGIFWVTYSDNIATYNFYWKGKQKSSSSKEEAEVLLKELKSEEKT